MCGEGPYRGNKAEGSGWSASFFDVGVKAYSIAAQSYWGAGRVERVISGLECYYYEGGAIYGYTVSAMGGDEGI